MRNKLPYSAVMAAKSMKLATGVGYSQQPGYLDIGIDTGGNKLYSLPGKAKSTNMKEGATYASSYEDSLHPFGVLTDEDRKHIRETGGTSQSFALHSELDGHASKNDSKAFTDALLKAYGTKPSKETVPVSFAAFSLSKDWSNLSPAQKSLGIASVGIQAKSSLGSEAVQNKVVPSSVSPYTGKSVTVGEAMGLMNQGYNGYTVAKKWPEIETTARILYGDPTLEEGAVVGKSAGYLGFGPNGQQVPITQQELDRRGARHSPAYGVGAVLVDDNQVPGNYLRVGKAEGKTVAIPKGNEHTSSIGNKTGERSAFAGSGISASGTAESGPVSDNPVGGTINIAAGTNAVYQSWGDGGVHGARDGAVGGAAIVYGLAQWGYFNPYVAAAIIAVSAIGGAVKTGKEQTQNVRDNVRSFYRTRGLLDKDNGVKLPDGSYQNLGLDGNGGQHQFKYADKAVDRHKGQTLNSYDIDYTNDMDFFSGLGGVALARLTTGQNRDEVRQVGGQFGNAALGKVGMGADMTPENFTAVMQNQRALYAKAGIKTKEEAMALANKGWSERRWSDFDYAQMQQAITMVFDNDFKGASQLAAGRFKGIDVASKTAGENPTVNTAKPPANAPQIPAGSALSNSKPPASTPTVDRGAPPPMSKEDAKAKNAQRFSGGY